MVVTLYYFDARGLMEPTRLVLAYGGEKFEEVRAPITGIPAVLPPEIKSSKFIFTNPLWCYCTCFLISQKLKINHFYIFFASFKKLRGERFLTPNLTARKLITGWPSLATLPRSTTSSQRMTSKLLFARSTLIPAEIWCSVIQLLFFLPARATLLNLTMHELS